MKTPVAVLVAVVLVAGALAQNSFSSGKLPTNDAKGQSALATSDISTRATIVVTGISASNVRGVSDPGIVVSLAVRSKTSTVMVRQIRVARAIDDQDRSLVPTAPNGVQRPMPMLALPSLTAMYRAANKGEPAPLGGSVNLKTPLPGARAIKLLEGELEVYAPTVANGGVAEIANFAARMGRPLDDALLSEAGIEIMPVDAQTYASAQDKFAFRGGTGFTQFFNLDAPGAMLYVNDPKGNLAGILFKGPDGRFIDLTGNEGRPLLRGGSLTLYKTFRPMPAGTTLVAYLYDADAILAIPFRFEEVPLSQ